MTGELAAWVGDGIAGTAVIGNVTMSIIQSRRRNRNTWLRLLEDAGGVSVEQVERAFDTRPAAAELFGIAMDAATRTQQRARHQLLAGIVAAGLTNDNAEVDVLLLLEQAAERLNDPHIRLLLLIGANPPQAITSDTNSALVGVTDARLSELWPEAAPVIVPLRLTLEREGLIRDITIGTWDGPGFQWTVEEFGHRMVQHYRALGGGMGWLPH